MAGKHSWMNVHRADPCSRLPACVPDDSALSIARADTARRLSLGLRARGNTRSLPNDSCLVARLLPEGGIRDLKTG